MVRRYGFQLIILLSLFRVNFILLIYDRSAWLSDVCWIDKRPKIYRRIKTWSLIKTTGYPSGCYNFFLNILIKLIAGVCLIYTVSNINLFLMIPSYKSCKCLFSLIAAKLGLSLSVHVIKLEAVNPVEFFH